MANIILNYYLISNMLKRLIILFVISSFFISNNQKLNLSFYHYDLSENELNYSKSDIRNPMLMSLFVPGLGQYIQGNKKKAALFFSIELLAIYLQGHYNNEGDNHVNQYKEYSSEHWNFEDWIVNYENWNAEENEFYDLFSNENEYVMIWQHSHHIDFYINNHPDFSGLYSTNDEMSFGYENNQYEGLYYDFTHYIPDEHNGMSFVEFYDVQIVRDHHFYEGIRKYNMFFAGWDDSDQIQLETQASGYNTATSPNKQNYNRIWNKSIEFYDFAQYAVTTLYLNHIISMFDIYFKNKFDNRISMKLNNKYNSNLKSIDSQLSITVNLK